MAYNTVELRKEILLSFADGQTRARHGGIDWNDRQGMSTLQGRRVWTVRSDGSPVCPHCFSTSPTHRCPLLVSGPTAFFYKRSKQLDMRQSSRVWHPVKGSCSQCGAKATGHRCPAQEKEVAA